MLKRLLNRRLLLYALIISSLACSQVGGAATIQILVLNAKNGTKVKNEKVGILIEGERDQKEYVTNSEGVINLEPDASAKLFVATEWWVTCRTVSPMHPKYVPVDQVLREGFTDENNCGHAKSEPIRGKLIIFARKATLAELFAK